MGRGVKKDRPVKVTCVLTGPLGGMEPPKLDALCELLQARRVRTVHQSEHGHRHFYEVVGGGQEISPAAQGKLPIPIKRITSPCGLHVACVSNPIVAEPLCDDVAHYTSALDTSQALRLELKERTKVMQSGGRFKSFRLPLRLQVLDRIVWFAVLRDQASDLRKLLKQCTHIGKKTSQGYGRVKEWIVETVDHDWSWFAESPDGPVLMRSLPASIALPEGCIGYRQSFGGCVGPYWQRTFWREVWEPC